MSTPSGNIAPRSTLARLSRPLLFAGLAGASLVYVGLLSLGGEGAAPTITDLKPDPDLSARVTRSERTNGTFTIGVSVAVTSPGPDGKVVGGLSAENFEVYE